MDSLYVVMLIGMKLIVDTCCVSTHTLYFIHNCLLFVIIQTMIEFNLL